MTRRANSSAPSYDSDASYSPEDDDVEDELFDRNGSDHSESETEATDVEDLSLDDEDGCDDIDVDDQVQFFGGNIHPPEYYRHAVESFNESAYETQDYSDGSLLLLDACEEQWRQYCKMLERDPQSCFESLSQSNALPLLYNFFDWSLNQKIGKDGRKRRGTRKSSSLGTYWKVFRLVHERATGNKLDPKLNRRMHKVLRDLAKKHGLSNEKRVNRCMTIEDLKKQIETTISTTEKSFKLGELRILAVLFLLLLAPAGARPTSILRMRFGDIRLVLARDPEGGPHNILIRFTLAFTKTYLGVKDAKTYPIPENLYDPSLLLSPHVFLLGILFRHRAFRATSLASPAQLANLDIHPQERELPLPLRDELKETHIFRRAVKNLTGFELSQDKPISYQMVAQWIRKVGEVLGLEYPTIPYNLRYNAANEFDRSADISEALRNLAMGHANSTPFQRHYLGREIGADTWAILRRQKPQQALIMQACSVGHSISKRRPTDLTPEQLVSVNNDALIKRLERDLRRHRQGSKKYMELRRELRNEKQRLKRQLKQKVRDEWTAEQAVDDIERQLRGVGFAKGAANATVSPQRPAQKRLMEALTVPLGNTLEGQYQRRDNAISAIMAYCVVEEGQTIQRHTPSVESRSTFISEPPVRSPQHMALMSVFVKNEKERPRRCFICVGKALTLAPDDVAVEGLFMGFICVISSMLKPMGLYFDSVALLLFNLFD
ncbi:uncharacterized protein G6M90_00g030440 [Metarhizium brunneum]|uniref:C2H2 finger domain-containing protein n=1 Tax=Metarhizium brunneum TaxID=500148 RepID=A0A7D5UUB6_9HYPO|nr:hypothetical protein G6M90_00g030440 [Metarhizium brunneum]